MPLMVIFNWDRFGLIWEWDGLIIMYLVLLSLRANLLAQNHDNRFSFFLLAIEINSLIFECDVYRVVSSANDKV